MDKICKIQLKKNTFVTSSGNSKETICDRKIRGNAIVSETHAILRDIPLGNQRTQIGLVLRQAWFINGCFVNSEVWTGYSESDLKDLEVMDHDILRAITGSQAKVPTEMLYYKQFCTDTRVSSQGRYMMP